MSDTPVYVYGTIKYISEERGFGFIKGDDSTDYFFHMAEIGSDFFYTLTKGDGVTFQSRPADKGPRAFAVAKLCP